MNNSYSHYYPQPPAPSYPTPYPPLDPQQPPHFYAQQQPLPSYPAQYAQPMPINHRLLSSSRQLPPSAVSVSIAAPAGPAYNYGHLQQDDIHMHIAPTYLTSHASQEYMSHPTEQQLIIREANVVGALGRADDMSVDTNNTKTKRAKSAKKSEPPKVEKGSFSIAICERGKCGPCLFSCCCSQCAAAMARTHLDGSSCCFNLLCVNPFIVRWLVRSAYNIPGSVWEDLLLTVCCPICSINQMYQTTIYKGSPVKEKPFTEDHKFGASCEGEEYVFNCVYGLCCSPCIVGHTLETAFDMPYCLGFCCINICVMSNLVRHHYRILGNTCFDDIIPHFCKFFVAGMACACPCGWKFFVSYINNSTLGPMHLAEDNRLKQPPRYLNP